MWDGGMFGLTVRSTLIVSRQDEWGMECGLGWPTALMPSTSLLNPGTKYSTEALWFSYQTTKPSLWGRRLLKRQLTWKFTRCSKASWYEPKKLGRPGWEPHPLARIYKSSEARSGIHHSGASFSELLVALHLAPCPSTAPRETALPGSSQWPPLPPLLPRMPTAWVAFICPAPSRLAPGSWITVRRPAASPLYASQPATSKRLVSPALSRWPAPGRPPASLIPAQLPAAGHSPLSPVAVSPWVASLLSANQWEECPLSASQWEESPPSASRLMGSPERTSSPVCPAAEELAKCAGACERSKTPWPASCVSSSSNMLPVPE